MGLSDFLLNLPSIFQNSVVYISHNMIELDINYPVDLGLPDRIIIRFNQTLLEGGRRGWENFCLC